LHADAPTDEQTRTDMTKFIVLYAILRTRSTAFFFNSYLFIKILCLFLSRSYDWIKGRASHPLLYNYSNNIW